MKHDLILCRTVYQLIVAIQMKLTILDKRSVDIIISDELPNYEFIVMKLEEVNIFDNVIWVTTKSSKILNGKLCNLNVLRNIELRKNTSNFDLLNEIDRYDNYYFANLGDISIQIARFLLNHNDIEFNMFEDGVSSYSKLYGDIINERTDKNLKDIIKYKYIPNILGLVKAYYVFSPEIMVWKPLFSVKEIPKINMKDNTFKRILNLIYNMDELEDLYSEKVIFFEESYLADGIEIDDMKVVNKLEIKYGRNEIFIKTHPRNSKNRFRDYGYKTNINKSIPWEAIALNIDVSDKILVSMTSTAVVSSFLLLNSSAKIILEYNHLKQITNNKRVLDTIEVIEKIKTVYPEIFLNIHNDN